MIKIDSQSFEITQLNAFFNKPGIKNEIHCVSYVDSNELLICIIKEKRIRVFDYKKGKTIFEIETFAEDLFIQGMVSLQEVLRH